MAPEKVASLLWNGDWSAKKRRRLNQLVYDTNSKVFGAPRVMRQGLRLGLLGPVECDLDLLRPEGMSLDLNRLQEAVRGEFLTDFLTYGEGVWAHWVEGRRKSTVHKALAIAASSAERARDRGDWASLRVLEAVIDGGIGAGQAVCAEPDEPVPTGERSVHSGSRLGAEKRRLVGARQTQADTLAEFLSEAGEGVLRIGWVQGAEGSGKSSLLNAIAEGMASAGWRVLRARTGEIQQSLPLFPLSYALQEPFVCDALRELESPWREVIAHWLMPQVQTQWMPPPQIAEGQISARLCDGVLRLLERLTAHVPHLLLIDDIEQADSSTLALLDYLVRRWGGEGLSVCASLRSPLGVGYDLVKGLKGSSIASGNGWTCELEDLSEQDAYELAMLFCDRSKSETTVKSLVKLSEGNPLRMALAWSEMRCGRLDPTDVLLQDIQDLQEPAGADRWIDRLPSGHRFALDVVACSGGLDHQAFLLPRLGEDARSVIQDLVRWDVLREDGRELHFRHRSLRAAVYQRISEPDRRRLHSESMAFLLREGGTARHALIALHASRSGASSRTFGAALRGAQQARRLGALPEAVSLLTLARRVASSERVTRRISSRIGFLLHQTEEFEAALSFFRASHDSETRKDRSSIEALSSRICELECERHTSWTTSEELIGSVDDVISDIERAGLIPLLPRALDLKLRILDQTGDFEGARSLLGVALKTERETEGVARVHSQLLLVMNLYYGDPTEAHRWAKIAVRDATKLEDPELLARALNRLALVELHRGGLGSRHGRAVLRLAKKRARRSGSLELAFLPKANLGVWYLDIGALDQAEAEFKAALELLEPGRSVARRQNLFLNLGELEIHRGRWHEALQYLMLAKSLDSPSSPQDLGLLIQGGIGLCHLEMGELHLGRLYRGVFESLDPRSPYDPTLPALLSSRFQVIGQKPEAALDTLLKACGRIEARLVPCWCKLGVKALQLSMRQSLRAPPDFVDRLRDRIFTLGLVRYQPALERYLNRPGFSGGSSP